VRSINDAGVVAMRVAVAEEGGPLKVKFEDAYVWEQGTITPVATADLDVPGGGKIAGALGAWVNNKNRTLLLAVGLQGSDDYGLYRFADGQRTPLLLPGQEMPGGGKYKTLASEDSVSFASEAGEHAFLARLDDGPTAAYLLGADGKLSLILKSGATTDL